MKNETLKRKICAALAALIAVMSAGCGKVTEPQQKPAETAKQTSAEVMSSDISESSQAEESSEVSAKESSEAQVSSQTEESSEAEESSQTDDSSRGEAVLKPVEREKTDDFDTAYRNYCADMFRMSVFEDVKAGDNVMVSPESIAYALAMLENGADGETLSQIEDLFYGIDISVQNEKFSQMIEKANSSEEVYFNIADSAWLREGGYPIAPEYLSDVQKYFGADIISDPFDDDAYHRVNRWISDNTDGMIPEALDDKVIDEHTQLLLVNAMCFEAEWEEEYEDNHINEEAVFTAYDGEEQQCAMMNSEEDYYIEGNGAEGFAKMYKGGKYVFVGLLPDEGTTPLDYIADLDGRELEDLWDKKVRTKVNVGIPEFKADYDVSLIDPLISMGMTDAFNYLISDLSGITGCDNDLYVKSVLHGTHIEVDRKGTKAAAATVIQAGNGSYAIDHMVYLDRPFVYMIVDTETGMPIFMGVVNSIE